MVKMWPEGNLNFQPLSPADIGEGSSKRQLAMKGSFAPLLSLCPPTAFISERVAMWQSSGRRERKSNPIQRLRSAEYFANLEKPGKEQSLLATTSCALVSPAVRGSPDPAPPSPQLCAGLPTPHHQSADPLRQMRLPDRQNV